MVTKKKLYIFCIFCILFHSCASFSGESAPYKIASYGKKSEKQLVNFFLAHNPSADKEKVERMASFYVEEGQIEGVNSDIAFVQMCLETGFLRFGGLVTEEMNNFCGLGSMDKNNPGVIFLTERMGVRGHIQHLQAYGSTKPLRQECIDPRYRYVNPRGKAETIFELAGTWATDLQYGEKLQRLLQELSVY